jgi:uncharacterized protein
MNRAALLEKIREHDHFKEDGCLARSGIHGMAHWERVRENGLFLARSTGADLEVIEHFALLHDSRRHNDGIDPDHGPRAAELIGEIAAELIPLADDLLELLIVACRDHTRGFTTGDPTVITCWDADRLDIGRVGIRPDPERLCTETARDPEVIEWGWRRSRNGEA